MDSRSPSPGASSPCHRLTLGALFVLSLYLLPFSLLPFYLLLPHHLAPQIVRQLIDDFSEIPNSLPLQVEVCKELIDWAATDRRIYLKQNLETRLVALYLDNRMYTDALALIAILLKELKRLDDKLVLVEVQLLESRCYHALRNVPKSRVSCSGMVIHSSYRPLSHPPARQLMPSTVRLCCKRR